MSMRSSCSSRENGTSATFRSSCSLSDRPARFSTTRPSFLMLYFFKCSNLNLAAPVELLHRFAGGPNVAPDDTYAAALFHSGWFVESIITQTLIVHVIRTRKIPFIQSTASPALFLSTLSIISIGSVIPYIPPVASILEWCRSLRSSGPPSPPPCSAM